MRENTFAIAFAFVTLLSMPAASNAAMADLTFLDSRYRANDIGIPPFRVRAMTLDADGNFYTTDVDNDDGTGRVTVLRLSANDFAARDFNINNFSTYLSYATTGNKVNGLAFGSAGNLFVSESIPVNGNDDRGLITNVTPAGTVIGTVALDEFRPTGIAVDAADSVYFPGRLESIGSFGNLYRSDQPLPGSVGTNDDILASGVVATGIELNPSGDIFFSTTRGGQGLVPQSLYQLDSSDPASSLLIATFGNDSREEIFSDSTGALYVFENRQGVDLGSQTIVRIAPIPIPAALPLFISALAAMGFLARQRNVEEL